MRPVLLPVGICVAVTLAAGCASAGQRALQAPGGLSKTTSVVAGIEQQDPQLRELLLQLAILPSGEVHRRIAERYRELGVLDTAHRHLERALTLNSRDAPAHEGMARIWRDWGDLDRALGSAHRAVFFAPESAPAQNTLGTVLQALGRIDEARVAFERAARLDAAAAYAWSNLCYLSFLQGDLDGALAGCLAALAIDPGLKAARNNLALVHAAAGRLDLAYETFVSGGNRAEALFNMGIVHMARGDYSEAAKAFDAASREAPAKMAAARERARQAKWRARETPRNRGDQR